MARKLSILRSEKEIIKGSGAGLISSDTQPTIEVEGLTWYNKTDGLRYIFTNGSWEEDDGGRVKTYATQASLPTTGPSDGDLVFAEDTDTLFMWNSGWYKIGSTNAPPVISGVLTEYELATDGTPTVITVNATDPEGFGITYGYSVTSGSLGTTATVSQSSNQFTITPGTTDPTDAGTFSITFTASDGVNTATHVASFELDFSLSLYDFTSFTFDSANWQGRTGPSLANFLNHYDTTTYPWLLDSNYYSQHTVGIQEWTVPADGNYQIIAEGASGAGATGTPGARVVGTFTLVEGEVIRILVGQTGVDQYASDCSGGGGSFVVRSPYNTDASILCIAGGGGGRNDAASYGTSSTLSGAGQGSTSGGASYAGGAPGSLGYGGTHTNQTTMGGAGFYGDAIEGPAGSNKAMAKAFINGGNGGQANYTTSIGKGGFGGGGASGRGAGFGPAGGGGGYTGGAGGYNTKYAGGGGSYNNGTNQTNTTGGSNSQNRTYKNGIVTITRIL